MRTPHSASVAGGVRLAVGFFDGVHLGHRKILAGANAVLTFMNHPLSVLDPSHAPSMLMDVDDRLACLERAGARGPRDVRAVRFTRGFAEMRPEGFADFLRREYPAIERIHCGANWRFGRNGEGTPAMLRAMGFDVKVCRYAKYGGERVSSTRIRAALSEGALADANAMLGRPFSVSGTVVRGKGVGRLLGAPTLNLTVAPPLMPGVYAVDTSLGHGVANYGVAPTMGRKAWAAPVLEVHLLDGSALDGAQAAPTRLRVEFLSFIRHERMFASQEMLREQIAADIGKAAELWYN